MDDFTRWYREYPRHVGRKAAEKSFAKVMDSGEVELEHLIQRTIEFRNSDIGKGPKKFIPHPATWLNQGRYDDGDGEWQEEWKPGDPHEYPRCPPYWEVRVSQTRDEIERIAQIHGLDSPEVARLKRDLAQYDEKAKAHRQMRAKLERQSENGSIT